MGLHRLGLAPVFQDDETGEVIADTDGLRRPSMSGVDVGYYDDDDEDDWEDDDDFEGDDDDFDDDFEGDDDDFEGDDEDFEGDLEDEELAGPRRSRRRQRRLQRRQSRLQRRMGRVQRKMGKGKGRRKTRKGGSMRWGKTAVGDSVTLTEAGTASAEIRLQHHFQAEDITFAGSSDGAVVKSIFFGDRLVWSSADGISCGVFEPNSFLRGLLKGQRLKEGLDIRVEGYLSEAGTFACTIFGLKPINKG